MIFPVFAVIVQLFFLDSGGVFDLFFKIHNVSIISRHYAKITLLSLMAFLALLNVRLILIPSGIEFNSYLNLDHGIFNIGVTASLFLMCYNIKSLIGIVFTFVGINFCSLLVTYLLSNYFSPLSPFLLISVLFHSIYYPHAIRSNI